MPAKKPAAKSKKASKPVKTVVKKGTPAKKAAKPKPSAQRVAVKRASEKPVVKKSGAAPKAAAAAPKAAAVSKPKIAAVIPAAKAKAAPQAAPQAAPKVAPKAAPKAAPVAAEKPQAKAPAYVTAVAEKSTRQKAQAAVPAQAADADDADAHDPSTNLLAGPRNVRPYVPKRGEQYMGKEQLDHFRQILTNWKRDLMEEVDRTVHHMKDDPANFPDPNDRATQESEFSLELRTRDRERKLIRKIDEALKRIEDGSYGYCIETGEEIGVKRLEARPVATLSVEAQERRERREKQYGDRDDRYR
jgi:DnaK suppressor protein